MSKKLYLLYFLFACVFTMSAQHRFQNEVDALVKKYEHHKDSEKETVVFTGSSSIRLWKNLDSLFPKHQIINTGFGASLSGDLLHFSDELILKYQPDKIFIYEGDNDIAYNKTSNKVINNLKKIVGLIRAQNSKAVIILISAKPSKKRWKLKKKYKRFNRKLKRYTRKDPLLAYLDIWKPMLKNRQINTTLFQPDGLHMNTKGYSIWFKKVKPFLN